MYESKFQHTHTHNYKTLKEGNKKNNRKKSGNRNSPDIKEMMQLVDKDIKATIIKIIHLLKKVKENVKVRWRI